VTATKIVPGLVLGWFNFQVKRLGVLPRTEGGKEKSVINFITTHLCVQKHSNDEV
jgi:hypothetical protein